MHKNDFVDKVMKVMWSVFILNNPKFQKSGKLSCNEWIGAIHHSIVSIQPWQRVHSWVGVMSLKRICEVTSYLNEVCQRFKICAMQGFTMCKLSLADFWFCWNDLAHGFGSTAISARCVGINSNTFFSTSRGSRSTKSTVHISITSQIVIYTYQWQICTFYK